MQVLEWPCSVWVRIYKNTYVNLFKPSPNIRILLMFPCTNQLRDKKTQRYLFIMDIIKYFGKHGWMLIIDPVWALVDSENSDVFVRKQNN